MSIQNPCKVCLTYSMCKEKIDDYLKNRFDRSRLSEYDYMLYHSSYVNGIFHCPYIDEYMTAYSQLHLLSIYDAKVSVIKESFDKERKDKKYYAV